MIAIDTNVLVRVIVEDCADVGFLTGGLLILSLTMRMPLYITTSQTYS